MLLVLVTDRPTMATVLSLLPWLALAGLLGSMYYVWYRVFSYQGIPDSLAFASSDGSFLSRGRASLRSVLGVDALLLAGHRDVRAEIFLTSLSPRVEKLTISTVLQEGTLLYSPRYFYRASGYPTTRASAMADEAASECA